MTDERKVAGAAVALLAVAATLALAVGTAAAPARPHVSVYFVQGEQLAVVHPMEILDWSYRKEKPRF